MLNPELYDKLNRLFDGNVRVANAGQRLVVRRVRDYDGKERLHKEQGGEEYRVCCPMCTDTRYRLYVNHAWGLDQQHGYPSSKLVVCHNCHAESADNPLDPQYRGNVGVYLQKMLRPYLSDVLRGLVHVARPMAGGTTKGSDSTTGKVEELPFPRPEWCTPFQELEAWEPAHAYWTNIRWFDPVDLGVRWGVVQAREYPVTANGKDYSWLAGWSFFPTGNDGWQCRRCDDTSKFKYFTKPGWAKSRTVYNLNNAKRFPFAIVCEGVTDVWRVGRPGVCLFGKEVSQHQAKLLAEQFSQVLFLLDPDAHTDGTQGRVSSVLKGLGRLRRVVKDVALVRMPEGRDPADCTYDQLWTHIERTAAKHGLREVQRP